ncbi:protein-disulfide isomerase [Kineobactrum sediminis]|uniref:Thiol:disulfide interchange protein n=1 Tax=Kineobactrum sediminis TaxID=1905677 RepID=A0A2N5XYJ5_9GAMM|nr:DsbC family protein [Kineobactrum sediminis]PLW81215.1 protein-disulfide isomerase [Kineobactrum sediminis]
MTTRIFAAMLALCAGLAVNGGYAGEPAEKEIADKLRKSLEVPSVNLSIASVETSEIEGMYAVQFKEGPLVYAPASGDYFIVGDMFTVGPSGYVNLAEKRRDGMRADEIAKVERDSMIVFPAEGVTRSHITVFTDITCFYCQKLHREVPELNKRGVEVRYLAYPRAGLASDGFRKLATAWCAAEPGSTLTRMKEGASLADNVCKSNPVASQYELGQALGVRGTPAIITASGQMIPGYQSAEELMSTLGLD